MIYDREKILKEIKPSEEELEKGFGIYNNIKEFIVKKFNLEVALQGSFIKGTSLKGDKDLDIFIFFSLDVSKEALKKRGLEIGKKVFEEFKGKYEIKYAEHPYVNGKIENHDVDIVPCYAIEKIEDMKSSVDRTPLHTKIILEKMTDFQKDDTRILKKFMKLINVYGSEFKVTGFSGYLCELLILYYESFERALENASEWKQNQKIIFEKVEKEFSDPLIIIDPVDPARNAASCVSLQKFSEFIYYSREFFKNKKFEKIKTEYKKSEGTELIVLNFKTDIMEDLLFPQLRKTRDFIKSHLEKNGFRIYKSKIFNSGILFEFEVFNLPRMKIHEGPFIYDRENCETFIKKHKTVVIIGDRICTEIERKFKTAQNCIEFLIEDREGFGKDLKKVQCFISKEEIKEVYD
ncbi:MAG: CCA tRNA nucleotidyltransferase [Methanomicrobia archaeon]|nr:CCA tRNA nucleotidyltransferase [Methanomicrobia archaeon]